MLLGDGGAGIWDSAPGHEPQPISLAPAGGAVAFSLIAAFLNHCPAASLFFVFPKLSTLLTQICPPWSISTQTIIQDVTVIEEVRSGSSGEVTPPRSHGGKATAPFQFSFHDFGPSPQ